MGFFTSYTEVYATLNLEQFFRAKQILTEHQIDFKDTSTNRQLKLAFNNINGRNIALSRDGSVKAMYSLSVKKADEKKARDILRATGC